MPSKTVTLTSAGADEAKYKPAINEMIAEIDGILKRMKRQQAEIDRLKARTRAKLAELDVLMH
jgi:hypothetical protein